MEPDLLVELQALCKDALESSLDGTIDLRKLITTLNNLHRRNGGGRGTVADLVKEWVTAMGGMFHTKDMHMELGFSGRDDKKAANMALTRLVEEGVLVGANGKRGWYRPVNQSLEALDWQTADTTDTLDLAWPLGLENLFTLYPTNICILAGEKNAGKTAFLMELAYLNARSHRINYFSSEMMGQELAVRIGLFGNPEPFKEINFYAINSEVGDLVEPDAVNIVDFLELTDEFWKVSSKIRRVFDRLKKGVAIIALQKKPGESMGRGGAFSSEKARVYLSMNKKALTLEVVKNWRGGKNPNGRVLPFNLRDSHRFELKQASGEW